MFDYFLCEVKITSKVPNAFAYKLGILDEHEWMGFDPIPKINLLKGENVECEFLCLKYYNENTFLYITDLGNNGHTLRDLAKQYGFSFSLSYYSVLTLEQGIFVYDYLLDKIEEFELCCLDYSGVKYDEVANIFTYEGVEYKYREQLSEYLIKRKKRIEKINSLFEDKDLFKERLPAPSGNRSNLFYKIRYAIRKLIAKYLK